MAKNILIVGGGLVGSLLGIFLARRGQHVRIYERRNDMRVGTTEAGRSINLALSDRGIKALRSVGVLEKVLSIAIPMHGRYIHNADGSTAFQPYGKDGQFIHSVSRSELNKKLMDEAEASGVQILFNQKLEKIDWTADSMQFENKTPSQLKNYNADVVFAADGAYSACRLQHLLQHERFDYDQSYIDFGYKELTIPPGENGTFQLEKNALHIWPRGNYMLIALPNIDGSFTCTLFFPFEGSHSFATINSKQKVKEFFAATFKDVFPLMRSLEDDFFNNPTSSLVTVKCYPWIRSDKFALIGDAAHAIVPFFGQGMNCGFEDCSVLDGLVAEHSDNWEVILEHYQRLRKPDCDAIADMALNNFIEMRDKVADPKFLLQKKIEAKLHSKYPDKWVPAYSMVTFSPHIRYSDALNRSKKQEAIMVKIMSTPGIETKWDDEELHQSIIRMT